MLEETTKDQIRAAIEALRVRRPGFRTRRSQNAMIAAVARTAARDDASPRQLLVEAPTGTGKSLAYLLGAVLPAKARGKKVVIATATIALQEQLMQTDIPSLVAQGGLPITAMLAKGRGRFACDWQLQQLDAHNPDQADLGFDDDDAPWERPPTHAVVEAASALAAARRARTWDGDLDRWPERLSEDVLAAVTVSSSQCLGRECPRFNSCPFVNARAGLFNADVVVTNQNLLLADLSLGGGAVLPDPEDTVYVVDEAHHLIAKATEQFAHHVEPDALVKQLQRGRTAFASALRATEATSENVNRWAEDVAQLVRRLAEPARMLEPTRAALAAAAPIRQRRGPEMPEQALLNAPEFAPLWRWAADTLPVAQAVAERFEVTLDAVQAGLRKGRISTQAATAHKGKLAALADRCRRLVGLLEALSTDVDDPDMPPVAKWASWSRRDNANRMTLSAACVSPAQMLRERLWARADAVVLTSATLSSLGNFDRYLDAAGLDPSTTGCLRLPSPFRIEEQAELVVCPGAATQQRASIHTRELTALVRDRHSPTGGTLVLFTSHRQMREVYDALDATLQARVLRQGDASREVLLATHAERVGRGEASLLFGVAQLSEGLDLPGDLCVVVIVAKLPFAVPDGPIERTREEWIKGRGGDYFMEVVVPEAHLRLTQMLGRLVRTETDRGVIYVADGRLASTRYGRLMLDTLPPYRRVASAPTRSGRHAVAA